MDCDKLCDNDVTSQKSVTFECDNVCDNDVTKAHFDADRRCDRGVTG